MHLRHVHMHVGTMGYLENTREALNVKLWGPVSGVHMCNW
jgi:hypothetical protein